MRVLDTMSFRNPATMKPLAVYDVYAAQDPQNVPIR